MLSRRSLCAFALCAAALLFPTRFAAADEASPRVATVNTVEVFNKMQETKDLKQKMDSDGKAINDELGRRKADLQEAQKQRELYVEGTPDYEKANKVLIEKAIATQVWQELINADLGRQQKSQMRNLFTKIEEATKEVADAKKIDLVIVDQKMDLPTDPKFMEQIKVEQLRELLMRRAVIYNNGRLDITNEVLAAVDAKYKARK